MKIEFLGIKIDKINFDQTLEKISYYFNSPKQAIIITVNAEITLLAQKNADFKRIINEAEIATCDGSGPAFAAKILKGEKLFRVTGVDLVSKILELSENGQFENGKLFLLGGESGVASNVAQKFQKAKIVGAESGGKLVKNKGMFALENNSKIIQQINSSGANMLFVAFGMEKQEMWIKQNLHLMPNIKVAVGVGGTFDFISGKIKRAPKWMRIIGLEWLFRLIQQPRKRFKRIYSAVVKFGFLVLKEKIKLSL